jgi:hypothetical protein
LDLQPTAEEINKRYSPLPHARIALGIGHFVMLEAPAVFNGLLEATIEGVQATSFHVVRSIRCEKLSRK